MKIDGSLARNIDFEVANLEVHKKTRTKWGPQEITCYNLCYKLSKWISKLANLVITCVTDVVDATELSSYNMI